MKKVGRILVAILLVISVTWSAVSTFLLYRSRQIPAHIRPIITQAYNDDEVGQLRLPKMWESLTLNKTRDFADLEFLGLEKGKTDSITGKPYDELKFKVTLREKVNEDEYLYDFRILHYCPEDGFWYAVYHRTFARLWGRQVSGERISEYRVPPDILEEPGRYAFVLDNLGNCSFEVE